MQKLKELIKVSNLRNFQLFASDIEGNISHQKLPNCWVAKKWKRNQKVTVDFFTDTVLLGNVIIRISSVSCIHQISSKQYPIDHLALSQVRDWGCQTSPSACNAQTLRSPSASIHPGHSAETNGPRGHERMEQNRSCVESRCGRTLHRNWLKHNQHSRCTKSKHKVEAN